MSAYILPTLCGPPGFLLASPSGLTDGMNQLVWANPAGVARAALAAVRAAPAAPAAPPAADTKTLSFRIDWAEEGVLAPDASPSAATLTRVACLACLLVDKSTAITFTDAAPTIRGVAPVPEGWRPAHPMSVVVALVDMTGGYLPALCELDARGFFSITPMAGTAFAAQVESYTVLPFAMTWRV